MYMKHFSFAFLNLLEFYSLYGVCYFKSGHFNNIKKKSMCPNLFCKRAILVTQKSYYLQVPCHKVQRLGPLNKESFQLLPCPSRFYVWIFCPIIELKVMYLHSCI